MSFRSSGPSRALPGEPAALVFEERQYTLPRLDALANGLAASLSGRGVAAGDRVALMASNRPEFAGALHAVGDHPLLSELMPMLQHIKADRITVEMAVAPIALAIASQPRLKSYDLSSLRFIMWGATPVSESIAETVSRRTGVGWVPTYGTTELPVIACNPLDGARLDSVGQPVPGVQVRVVSLETGKPVSPGEVGEIQAWSESLMAGYLPCEATREALCDGWYRTGDVGYLDTGGWLQITDRSKETIKVRGFQVAPAEIEAVLHGHPAVEDCAVFGVPDGVDGEAVVAAVATCAPVDAAELIARVGARLASYKRLSRVVFVAEIPRLPSGKVLRRLLKESYGCTPDS